MCILVIGIQRNRQQTWYDDNWQLIDNYYMHMIDIIYVASVVSSFPNPNNT